MCYLGVDSYHKEKTEEAAIQQHKVHRAISSAADALTVRQTRQMAAGRLVFDGGLGKRGWAQYAPFSWA